MNQLEKNFCFCTLALGNRYQLMAKELAKDLKKYSPGTVLVVYTDSPDNFSDCLNVKAFKHIQKSVLRCVNDKRFLLEKALSMYEVVIHIDADTKIVANIPENLTWLPGITSCQQNLLEHLKKSCPQYIEPLTKVAAKLNIDDASLANAKWIGESIYAIARDEGREIEFLKIWGIIVNYMELRKLHPNDGNLMGVAAAKVGLPIHYQNWEEINQARQHLDASFSPYSSSFWEKWSKRIAYHYRFNKAKLMALKNFDFYYR